MIMMGDHRTRRVALLAIAFAVALPIQAAWADNDVGCGVGTQIWEGETGLAPKLAASFTNGLTFQSISITFGLVNCNGRNTVTADAELRKFAAGNIDRLSLDMARGSGESLDALADLIGLEQSDRAAFTELTRSNFATLFPSDRTTSGEMLDALDALLREDEQLSRYARS
jgi:hypothetical protein